MKNQSIVSLVPSLTELLFDLGLGDQVVGRTRFCIHPKSDVESVPIIGGTKNPKIGKIQSIKPDLIIANHEENRKKDVEELQKDFEVMVTKISTIEEALFGIHQIGKRCDVLDEANELINAIQREFDACPDEQPLSVAYLIWKNPWMTVGGDTYVHSVLSEWNLVNVFGDERRYPKISLEQMNDLQPDVILLSSEPFPFKDKHIQEISEVCPNSSVLLVDGEWFSWYGSRMLTSFKKLNSFRRAIS